MLSIFQLWLCVLFLCLQVTSNAAKVKQNLYHAVLRVRESYCYSITSFKNKTVSVERWESVTVEDASSCNTVS